MLTINLQLEPMLTVNLQLLQPSWMFDLWPTSISPMMALNLWSVTPKSNIKTKTKTNPCELQLPNRVFNHHHPLQPSGYINVASLSRESLAFIFQKKYQNWNWNKPVRPAPSKSNIKTKTETEIETNLCDLQLPNQLFPTAFSLHSCIKREFLHGLQSGGRARGGKEGEERQKTKAKDSLPTFAQFLCLQNSVPKWK